MKKISIRDAASTIVMLSDKGWTAIKGEGIRTVCGVDYHPEISPLILATNWYENRSVIYSNEVFYVGVRELKIIMAFLPMLDMDESYKWIGKAVARKIIMHTAERKYIYAYEVGDNSFGFRNWPPQINAYKLKAILGECNVEGSN